MKLVQVALRATDLDRAAAFYGAVLGTEPTGRFNPPGLVFFGLASAAVGLAAAAVGLLAGGLVASAGFVASPPAGFVATAAGVDVAFSLLPPQAASSPAITGALKPSIAPRLRTCRRSRRPASTSASSRSNPFDESLISRSPSTKPGQTTGAHRTGPRSSQYGYAGTADRREQVHATPAETVNEPPRAG